jgi:flagellar basal body-associated protein FliL
VLSQSAIVLLIVAIVVIAIVIALAATFSRRSRLRPLPEESRDKYARSWRGVENRFIDDPTGAVNEADRMVVMMLSE